MRAYGLLLSWLAWTCCLKVALLGLWIQTSIAEVLNNSTGPDHSQLAHGTWTKGVPYLNRLSIRADPDDIDWDTVEAEYEAAIESNREEANRGIQEEVDAALGLNPEVRQPWEGSKLNFNTEGPRDGHRMEQLHDRFTGIDDQTQRFTEEHRVGHLIFRCACGRGRVQVIEYAWANLIVMMKEVGKVLVNIHKHYEQHAGYDENSLTLLEENQLLLFKLLLQGNEHPLQALGRMEKAHVQLWSALSGLNPDGSNNHYKLNIWCDDLEWVLQEDSQRARDGCWKHVHTSNARMLSMYGRDEQNIGQLLPLSSIFLFFPRYDF
ncbi:hypothetical protein BDV25DRAFT_138061 [Aspergillus avenaceus]|uniref:Uncharacterized protein n=1 Tax=Aspergillus avenaceus TaxID=36643 RepID=A0A5N6U0T7_ASPAV|nr:hypothetical protein BDV25DRAFT_138061 [Aspergillus avenaceus]